MNISANERARRARVTKFRKENSRGLAFKETATFLVKYLLVFSTGALAIATIMLGVTMLGGDILHRDLPEAQLAKDVQEEIENLDQKERKEKAQRIAKQSRAWHRFDQQLQREKLEGK